MLQNRKYLQLCLVIICFSLFMFVILRSAERATLYDKFLHKNEYGSKANPFKLKESRSSIEIKYGELVFGDNITGYPELIVPNIVHNVLFGINELKFSHFISILSVLKNQKPDILYIHCDCQELVGDFYQRVLERSNSTKTRIIVRKIIKPVEIYGKPISKRFSNWHSSDITRLRVLAQFGGIYLDNDVYVVKSLDVFRSFEMTINWDEGLHLGNQVIIAHKNARFLQRWLDSYHAYDHKKWYFNAGELPTIAILQNTPDIVHRVKGEFGVDAPNVCPKIYRVYYAKWRQEFYTVHLVMRGNDITFPDWCFGKNKPKVLKFNEQNVMQLQNTFGEMCRDVISN